MKADDDPATTSQPSSPDGQHEDDLASMFETRSHARGRGTRRRAVVVTFAIAGGFGMGVAMMMAMSGRVPRPPGTATTPSELAGALSSPEHPSVAGSAAAPLTAAKPGGDSGKPRVARTEPTPSSPAPVPEKSAPGG